MPLNDVYSGGSTPNMLIDARDVGKMVARIIKDERTLNKRVIAYGDVMSQNEIHDCIEDKTGEKLELVEVTKYLRRHVNHAKNQHRSVIPKLRIDSVHEKQHTQPILRTGPTDSS